MADLGFDFPDDGFEQETSIEDVIVESIPPLKDETHEVAQTEDKPILETMPEDETEDHLLAGEKWTPMERVYAFKENDVIIHRLLLAKELPIALEEMSIAEAVKHVLPIMDKLAYDMDDAVRETFSSELDQMLLYFYKNAPELFIRKEGVQEKTFVPLMISILLDQHSSVASLGQQAIIAVVGVLREDEQLIQVIDSEVYKGLVEGLMSIVDGKTKRTDINETEGRRSSISSEGLEAQTEDDIHQGEMNLAKITCISLVASIANILGKERCIDTFLPIIEQLSTDSMFYVRKEAAAAIGSLALVLDADVVEERLLPLYQLFSEDQIWHVRRSCILALPPLCSVLSEAKKTQLTITSVETFRIDVSRSVRNTLADIVGELIARFLPVDWEQTHQPGQIPGPLLSYFLSLGAHTNNSNTGMLKLEVDRPFICAYNFPAVVLTAGAELWDSHLRETYLNLTKDYQIKVRCTFAHSLHDIARIIGPERTERDLVQIFALYLMDLDDVKQGVLEHLADFLGTLAVSSRNEYIPILAEVWDGVATNWHLRNILAGQLREISLLFDASRVVEHVLPLVVRACHDEFAAVRQTGVQVFPVVLDVVKHAVEEDGDSLSQADGYGDDVVENKKNFALALLSHVMERLDEFARSDHYRGRLVFAHICQALIEAGIGASDFASFFLPRLAPLAHDPVVNVRIAASRTIGTIYTNEPFCRELSEIAAPSRTAHEESGHALDQMTYRFALDKDGDVRSFVMSFVSSEILEKQREKDSQAAAERTKEETMETTPNAKDGEDDIMSDVEERK
ncbi:armadillo-type protein [Sporodiniella umbellata]|nr:armadillo-type protein [Sporodiniella umbellata]